MFIYYLIIILVILVFLYYKFFFNAPFVDTSPTSLASKVKYIMSNSDKRYIKRNGKLCFIEDVKIPGSIAPGPGSITPTGSLFYCLKKWTTKNNNYIKVGERYYIIEPGYYYYYRDEKNSEVTLTINNNSKIYLINL